MNFWWIFVKDELHQSSRKKRQIVIFYVDRRRNWGLNLRNTLCTSKEIHYGFKTQNRRHQRSNTLIFMSPQKGIYVLQKNQFQKLRFLISGRSRSSSVNLLTPTSACFHSLVRRSSSPGPVDLSTVNILISRASSENVASGSSHTQQQYPSAATSQLNTSALSQVRNISNYSIESQTDRCGVHQTVWWYLARIKRKQKITELTNRII